MSDDFLTDPGQNADGSQLRKFAEAQKARADQLEQQFKQLQAQVSQNSLKSAFDQLNVPEKVRRFYDGEADPAKVKAWVDENKDVFNLQPPASTDNGAATSVAPEVQAQQQAVQAASGIGNEPDRSADLSAFQVKAEQMKKQSAQRNPNALNELLAGLMPEGSYVPPRVI